MSLGSKKNEENKIQRDLWGTIKQTNVCIKVISEEEGKKGAERFEEITAPKS